MVDLANAPAETAVTTFDRTNAERMLRLLTHGEAQSAIRLLDPPQEHRFTPDRIDLLLNVIGKHSGKRPVYVVLNPIRQGATSSSACDEDIECLRWLPLDADPIRPANMASTDSEKQAAFSVMRGVIDFLMGLLPDIEDSILRADSGNGYHALVRLPDYPVDEAPRLKQIGDALCRRFGTDQVHMDRSIYNPSRIWRLYGTMNVKGPNSPERPHRLAAILSDQPDPGPFDLLAHWDTIAGALDLVETKKAAAAVVPQTNGLKPSRESTAELPPWWSEAIPAGGRNNAAFRRARWLINGNEGSYCREQAWEQLAAWNKVCCRPPLAEIELRKVLDSAAKDGDNPLFVAPAKTPIGTDWPLIEEAAYYGLAGEIVNAIAPVTEADPIALLLHIIVAYGSAVGRSAHFIADGARHGGNEFVVLVGTTSKGRKGTSWCHPRRLFEQADPHWAGNRILSGLASGEGLIYNVRDPVEKMEKNKVTGEHEPVVIGPGVADTRLLAFEGEFASVLRQTARDGNTLIGHVA